MPTGLCRILGRHQTATIAGFMEKRRRVLSPFCPESACFAAPERADVGVQQNERDQSLRVVGSVSKIWTN
jgi:hypothetical protein